MENDKQDIAVLHRFYSHLKNWLRKVVTLFPYQRVGYCLFVLSIYVILICAMVHWQQNVVDLLNLVTIKKISSIACFLEKKGLALIGVYALLILFSMVACYGAYKKGSLREWRILCGALILYIVKSISITKIVLSEVIISNLCLVICIILYLIISIDCLCLIEEGYRKLLYRIRDCYEDSLSYYGFVTDTPSVHPDLEKELPSMYRGTATHMMFARSLVNRLLATDTHLESFAVDISGEWGSGKSTLMNTMKQCLNQDATKPIIIDFHPWNCRSVEKIESQFLQTLNKHLRPYDYMLSRSIKKYANLLSSMVSCKNQDAGKVIDIAITSISSSVEEQKEKVSNQMGSLSKKVFVFIDDMDRLEEDELYATMMLLRNTANFKNLIYVAALDKTYVLAQLGKRLKLNEMKTQQGTSKEMTELYLEKMFQLEITLPKIQEDSIINMLIHDIQIMLRLVDEGIRNQIVDFINIHKSLILSYIKNYRQCKRLAREFTNSYGHYVEMGIEAEISIKSVFLLELLKMVKPDIYKQLQETPKELIKISKDKNFYEIKNTGVSEPIMSALFDAFDRDERDICYKMNFDNYFYLHTSKDVLSIVEFQYMVNEAKKFSWLHIPDLFQQCIDNKINVETITYRFENYICKEDKKQVNGFLNMLAYWICSCYDEDLDFEKLTSLINANHFTKSNKVLDEYSNYFLQAFMDILQQDKDFEYLKIARIFTPLYNLIPENETYQHLLDNEQVKAILYTLFNKAYPDYTIRDILNPESSIYEYITQTNCCLNENTKKNPIWDVILTKLKGQKKIVYDFDTQIKKKQIIWRDEERSEECLPIKDLFMNDLNLAKELEDVCALQISKARRALENPYAFADEYNNNNI